LDGSPAANKGSLLTDRDHNLKAACEAKVLWKLELPKAVYYSCPAIGDNGTIYVSTGIYLHSDHGSLYAVRPDGSIKWSHTLAYNGYSPVIGQEGMILVQDSHNILYAFSPTGKLRWKFKDYTNWPHIFYDVGERVPAVAEDGTIYVAADGLYAISPRTGRRIWRFSPIEGKCCRQSPVIGADGTIYIFIHQHDFYAVYPDGTQKWHSQLKQD